MPAIEYSRTGESLGNKRQGIQVAEKTERSERHDLCALRDICRSRLCQFTNNDCLGSRKGN
jgi:hypothetical protein